MAHRMVGERGGDVDAREYVARCGDRLAAADRGFGEGFEMCGFGGDRVDARLRHAARGFVAVARGYTHDAAKRHAMGAARLGDAGEGRVGEEGERECRPRWCPYP